MKDANKQIVNKLKQNNIELNTLCVFFRTYSNNKTKYSMGKLTIKNEKVTITEVMDIYKPYKYKNWRVLKGITINYDNLQYIKIPTQKEKVLYKLWKYA
jgi:acyl-CoA-binding protein